MAGGFAWQGHVRQGACMAGGGMHGQEAGETATAVDGTYPTGMHPC